MIETHWYDALILYVKISDGRLEVRLGVVFVFVVLWLIWKLVSAFLARPGAE